MTSFDYSRAKATADRLIDRFGKDATLTQHTRPGTPYSPMRVPSSPVSIKVVEFTSRVQDNRGTLVGRFSRMFYVKASASVTIGKGDTITIDGTESEILEVKPLQPGSLLVVWEIKVAA